MLRSTSLVLLFAALATPGFGATIGARDDGHFQTAVDIYGDSISTGTLQQADIVREALDDLCKSGSCDETRLSKEWKTDAWTGDKDETTFIAVTISAKGTFPTLNNDGGQLARDSLKTAIVEAVRLGSQHQWEYLRYWTHPTIQAGYITTTTAEEHHDWFGKVPQQFKLTRSRTDQGTEAGDLAIEFHIRVINPSPNACDIAGQVIGGLSGALGLLPGAGSILGFLGSIIAGGLGNCAKRDGSGGHAYRENFTNNTAVAAWNAKHGIKAIRNLPVD
jgi:hypothetical protein